MNDPAFQSLTEFTDGFRNLPGYVSLDVTGVSVSGMAFPIGLRASDKSVIPANR
jgi:hypothetical protein